MLQNQESCKFMIWMTLMLRHQKPQRYRKLWIRVVSTQMIQMYAMMLEKEQGEWLKEMDVKGRTKTMTNVCLWSLHPRKGLLGSQLPQTNSHCTHKNTFTQSLFTSSFLRGLLLKITHSIFSHTQSNSKKIQKSMLPRSHTL